MEGHHDEGGSVQHLDFLTDEEKNVFKTFAESLDGDHPASG